jgi:hypothetical protein
MKSLTYRVTECQYDVDNPVVGFNQDDGPIIGPNHGGYPGTANVVRNHGDHF